MKSKPQDHSDNGITSAVTSCRECKFSIYEDRGEKKVQTGCEAGRLDKFESIRHCKDEDREYYMIGDACNYYALEGSEKNLKDIEQDKTKRFALIVYCDENNRDILKTVNSILDSDYKPERVRVIICHDYREELKLRKEVSLGIDRLVSSGHTSMAIVTSDHTDLDREPFRHTKSSDNFCCVLKAGEVVGKNCFKNINDSWNNQLAKYVFVESEGNSYILRKVISARYLDYKDYALMVDGVREEAIKQNLHLTI